MRLVTRVLMSALLTACADGDPAPNRSEDDQAGTVGIERIYDFGLSFGGSVSEITESLGAPTSVDTSVQENRHVPEETDSLFALEYAGLGFELNRPGPVDRDLLTGVSLTSPDRELPGGLRVGVTTDVDLRRRLGEAESRRSRGDTTVLSYAVPGEAANRFVEFLVARDTLRRIRWVPYVD
ncbi:MAG: hypothetical protein ACODAB_04075 [Gemmatimonadota bacterium]